MKILCQQNKASKQTNKKNKLMVIILQHSKYNCICSTGCEELWTEIQTNKMWIVWNWKEIEKK